MSNLAFNTFKITFANLQGKCLSRHCLRSKSVQYISAHRFSFHEFQVAYVRESLIFQFVETSWSGSLFIIHETVDDSTIGIDQLYHEKCNSRNRHAGLLSPKLMFENHFACHDTWKKQQNWFGCKLCKEVCFILQQQGRVQARIRTGGFCL